LNGIDISNYQTGIDLSAVPCDFVIILVTEGQRVVNTDWRRQCEMALSLGKAVMLYHYIEGGDASGEADTFWNTTREYSGRVCYAVDWEAGSNRAWGIESYLETLVKRLKANLNRTVILYAPSGAYPRGVAARQASPTWVAQYANTSATGYQDHPWNEGAYQADIRQYSGTGRLPGWGGDLDLDKSYATKQQWAQWAGNEEDMPLSDDDINKVVNGVWLHLLPNGRHARDIVSDATSDVIRMHDTGLVPGMMMHKLPNGRFLRDIVSDATSDVIRMHDSMIPELKAQNAALTTAMEALSKAVGANPEDIQTMVEQAVKAKLDSLQISITTTTKEGN
jgi:GH25 family lysozyme M1 (1,4-beta-N-acetylmuramidase)